MLNKGGKWRNPILRKGGCGQTQKQRKQTLLQRVNLNQKGICQGNQSRSINFGHALFFTRDQLKITLKIFLHDFDLDALFAAVKAALSKLATNRVDTLFVATPVEAIPHIGIGSGAAGPEQAEAQDQLVKLWKGVEQLIQEGKVGGAGLCDLHPPVFIQVYEEATIKPISIQVTNRGYKSNLQIKYQSR